MLTPFLAFSLPAMAQTVSNGLFNPVPGSFNGQFDPLRPNLAQANAPTVIPPANSGQPNPNANPATSNAPAESRIGNVPTYEVPPGSGAGGTGYDSSGKKKKPLKPPPGAPAKSEVTGPGTFTPPPQEPPEPLPPSATAAKPPLPPAQAGTVAGEPPRRKLKIDDDPFGAVGFYAGPFLTKAAVEISTGHDSNPGRIPSGPSSWFYMIAPELVMTSDWSRHSLMADLRGSFIGYGHDFNASPGPGIASPIPKSLDRPDFTGKVNGRFDVTNDTRIDAEARLRVSTDNPGSPSIQAGLERFPIYTTIGGTLGAGQKFNRLDLSGGGTFDRTSYQDSLLTDGTTSSNDDRNFNQYGGFAKASYELMPGVKPYAEVDTDTRVHDLNVDREGFQRDSDGVTGKVGTSYEFDRLITGDVSVGYTSRTYQDPRLPRAAGLLTNASLIWVPTGLTTVTLTAKSEVDESTLPNVSGVLARDYSAQVDHAFRRWLIGTVKFGAGSSEYEGATRVDRRYFAEGDIVYKLSRAVQVKGTVRREAIRSNVSGVDANATVFTLGMRYQP